MSFHPMTFSYPSPDNGVDGKTMAELFSQHLPEFTSGQLLFAHPSTPDPPTFHFPLFNPTSHPTPQIEYPTPLNGAEGHMFAQSLTHHFHYNFAELQGEENTGPTSTQVQDPPAHAPVVSS
ncbi:hypothetical protein HYDPIDRAFT_30624 [Hydnomerulius pinastri MD-312]|uniref:Uncharacterized protein n=1 Tax=Hydnomerulius pinastri MD-312 TaxID=994086 RepID=A0A0C9W5P5_9AGAM|nr:hypothetical protein HYDPIDRAFT_30624 [Hydnomerulius pinastri MD-312]